MKNILLVNPWIHDFALYNLGLKPVGLLRIAEHLRRSGHQVRLIDCLEGCEKSVRESGFSKIRKKEILKPAQIKDIKRPYFRYGIDESEFRKKIAYLDKIDEIYMTSGMTYWYPGIQFTISVLRDCLKDIPITLGGIYPTLCHDHALGQSGADNVHKGDLLDNSIFHLGDFYPAYDLLQNKRMLPIQLTRGCPFKCTYCASKLLAPGFEIKNPSHLFEEIYYYEKRFGTTHFMFYDDALLVQAENGIKPFLAKVIESGRRYSFYTPNGLHARYIDDEMAVLLKRSGFKELCISYETSDEILQRSTGSKVTTDELETAILNLKKAGFTKNELSVYILSGAPWVDMEKTRKDTEFIASLGAAVSLASYSPIPGTADYMEMVSSKVMPVDTDPIWHNKTVFADRFIHDHADTADGLKRLAIGLNRS